MNYNKAIVIGNITRDPELKSTPSGATVCTFAVATNRVWFDKNTNTKKEEVEFHNIVVWGKQAENVNQYMHKGDQIMIEGRLQTRSWEGQDGKKNYRTEIVAENVQFGSKRQQMTSSAPSDNYDEPDFNNPPPAQTEDINVDDIPF